MKISKQLLLLGVLFILAGATFFLRQRSRHRPPDNQPFPQLILNDIERIEITTPQGEEFKFNHSSDTWRITSPGDYLASKTTLDEIIDKVKNLTLSEKVSTQTKRHTNFEVNLSSAARLIIFRKNEPKPMADILIGKSGLDYNHHYLRYQGQPDVYISAGLPRYLLNKNLSGWREKKLFTIPKEEIKRIEIISSGQEKILLGKEGEEWWLGEVEKREKGDTGKINSLLDTLKEFIIDDFATPAEEATDLGFSPPATTIKVESATLEKIINVGKKAEYQYYLKVSGDPVIYKINTYKIERFQKKPSDFLPEKSEPSVPSERPLPPQRPAPPKIEKK